MSSTLKVRQTFSYTLHSWAYFCLMIVSVTRAFLIIGTILELFQLISLVLMGISQFDWKTCTCNLVIHLPL
jgi:hypothetical protein